MADRLRGGSVVLVKVLVQPHLSVHIFRVNQSVILYVCLVGLHYTEDKAVVVASNGPLHR